MWGVWRAIRNGAVDKEAIQTTTGISDNQVSNALRGLTFLRLIEDVEGYAVVALEYGEPTDRINFALTALSNISSECSVPPEMGVAPSDESEWGKQAVMPLTLEFFIVKNRQYFDRKGNNDLANRIDDWHQEIRFHPRDGDGDRNNLQGNKLDNWTKIMEFFGFVRPSQSTNYTVYIQPEVIHRILMQASHELPNEGVNDAEPEIDIRDLLGWISENLFRVSLTTDGAIPSIFAQSLVELSARDHIRLVETTDADSISLGGVSRPRSMDKAANCIKLVQ